ncbi:hypothetical protein MAR_024357, partial [Mya arenaria]
AMSSNSGANRKKQNGVGGVFTRNSVIAIGGAVSCPPLHVWDYVLTRMRVMGPSGMYMQYMPGRVCYVPRLPPLEHRFYSVRLYNGKVLLEEGASVILE